MIANRQYDVGAGFIPAPPAKSPLFLKYSGYIIAFWEGVNPSPTL
jgi:hypothetical protein